MCVHAHVCARACALTCMYMHMCAHMYVHVHPHVCTRMLVPVHPHVCTCVCLCACEHSLLQTSQLKILPYNLWRKLLSKTTPWRQLSGSLSREHLTEADNLHSFLQLLRCRLTSSIHLGSPGLKHGVSRCYQRVSNYLGNLGQVNYLAGLHSAPL